MRDEHFQCGCVECRIRLAADVIAVAPLTTEQYVKVIQSGELDAQ